ncbi:unnamed protein product [Symbiodinium sp. KB8]|nr:unnamed protein product [Symbiodinium sp. KB8]
MGGFPEGDAELLRQRRQRFLEKEQKLREEKDEHQANLYSALAELRNVIAEDMVETEEPEFFEDIQAEWDAFTKEVQEDDSAGISRILEAALRANTKAKNAPRTCLADKLNRRRKDPPPDPDGKIQEEISELGMIPISSRARPHQFFGLLAKVSISTTPAYTHVGGVLDHRASMLPEARRRLSIASTSTSYDEGKALLYGNNTIALPVRVAVFEAAIRPSCFNVALWLPVGRAWKRGPFQAAELCGARPYCQFPDLPVKRDLAVQKDLAWLRDREDVAGTICQACGKQFWAENKLAIHLRASAECVTKSCEPFQKALDHYHYPLYDQEVIEIVQHATKEIQHVKDAGLNWSPTQYEAALSYEDFNEAFGNVGWTELQDKIRDTHGTVAAPLQALIKPRTNL